MCCAACGAEAEEGPAGAGNEADAGGRVGVGDAAQVGTIQRGSGMKFVKHQAAALSTCMVALSLGNRGVNVYFKSSDRWRSEGSLLGRMN